MNAIPAEIVLAIVRTVDKKDLHALTLINRHFYTVANPLLWRDVDILNQRQFIQLFQSMHLSQGGFSQHIRSLAISTLITDALLFALIQQLPPSFQDLDLDSAEHITHESLKHLPSQCPQLTSLSLGHASVTDQSLVFLGEHCSQLRNVHFEECEALSPNVFAALAGCPLEQISILGKPIVNGLHDNATARKMALDLVGFPLLTKLSLMEVDMDLCHYLFATMDRDGNSPWPHLTDCCMEVCRAVDDQDAIRFIKAHPHLKDLQLSANNFSDAVLYVIADSLPGLIELDLSGGWDFTHRGVRDIIRKCPLLTCFHLESTHVKRQDFPELGPYSDEYLAARPDDLAWATELNVLHRGDLDIIRRASNHNNDNNNANVNDG